MQICELNFETTDKNESNGKKNEVKMKNNDENTLLSSSLLGNRHIKHTHCTSHK